MVDFEAGFGGVSSTYILAYKLFRQTDAAIAHIENQVPDVRVCGHAIEFNISGPPAPQCRAGFESKKAES